MRCQKCQYVGFEPSPRCKNCGYDFSFGNGESNDLQIDAAPGLTLVTEPELDGPMADFDLQIFDDVPAKKVQSGAKPFDLDDLLANGPSSGSLSGGYRDPEPVIEPVSAVARRRQSRSASASAVATPPPAEIEALFKPEPVVATVELVIDEPLAKPVVEPIPEAVPEPVVFAATVAEPAVVPEPEPEMEPAMMLTIEEEPIAEPVPEPVRAAVLPPPAPALAPVTTELPLFMQGMSEISEPAAPVVHAPVPASVEAAAHHEIDDRPLVQVPATPRAPLAVRRTTPDPARLRAKYGRAAAKSKVEPVETSGDLLLDHAQAGPAVDRPLIAPAARLSSEPTPSSLPAEWIKGVGPAKRLMAAALDSALLVGLNAAVIWFTLSVCGLTSAEVSLLPVAPLLLFFLLLDAGYLVLFTAACGQTIGKMAAGIRVVGTTTGAVINDRITISQAVMRALGSIVSMLPLGAGFWFGLVGDRRAVHDRLAHTRVVSA